MPPTPYVYTNGTFANTKTDNSANQLNTEFAAIDSSIDTVISQTNTNTAAIAVNTAAVTALPAVNVTIADAGNKYTAAEVENALQEIATFVGKAAGGTLYTAKYVGFDFDATTPGNVSITVPAATATSAILVTWGARFYVNNAPNFAGRVVPLHLTDGTEDADVSQSGSRDYKFECEVQCTAGLYIDISKSAIISTSTLPNANYTATIDLATKQYVISLGTPWNSGAGGTQGETNYWMTVIAL